MFYFCTLICTSLVVASKSYSIIQERKDLGLEEPSHQPLLPLPSPLLRSPPFFHSPRRFSYIQQPSTAVKPHESQLSFTLPFLALPFRPFTSIVIRVTFVRSTYKRVWFGASTGTCLERHEICVSEHERVKFFCVNTLLFSFHPFLFSLLLGHWEHTSPKKECVLITNI